MCGPTCIQMLSAYYGKLYNIDTILESCELTKSGVSIGDVVKAGERLGFRAVSFSVNPKEARRIPIQAIVYLKEGHFVIIEQIKHKRDKCIYKIIDPDYGRVELLENEFVDRWMEHDRGFGVLMVPKDDFLDINPENNLRNKNKEIVAEIKSVVREHKRKFVWIVLLTIVVLITNWAMPIILQRTIDDGIMKSDINFVWLMLLAQFLFFIGFMLSDIFSSLISTKLGFRINIDFIEKYFNKIVRLPIKYFDTTFRSDLIQRLSDLGRINGFITDSIIDMAFSAINLIVFSAILIVYNYKIFLIFALLSVISILYSVSFLKRRKSIDYSYFSIDSQRRNSVYELIMGMVEVKINNAYDSRIKSWNEIETKLNSLKLKKLYLDFYSSHGSTIIGRFRDIILTALSAYYVIQGEMSLGTMMMISFVLGQLSGPISDVMSYTQVVQDIKLSYDRLFDIHGKDNEDDNKTTCLNCAMRQGIKFQNVSFKYPGSTNPYILKNVNIDIPVGKITAIVGPSGGGKTTMLRLLMGFYMPSKGIIMIDGDNLNDINTESWREQCGVVMQNGYIFSASIAENIALSDEFPDVNRLIYAAKMANLYDFIESLPMRFNTKIGEIGVDLSGGEKQRLYIARAIYRDPSVVLLDEATSSLDANNEREIIDHLSEFSKNRTVIIIAHRLSTVKHADNIVFMDHGEVVEQGKHEQLINLKGAYYNLVRNQLD